MRQIALDTETTGINLAEGHRVIEIGCIEIINRRITDRYFHRYINPERGIDAGALAVHGIEESFLLNQPKFVEVAEDLLNFIQGAELIIHNAAFDLSFLNQELTYLNPNHRKITEYCSVTDSLLLARQRHPGQRNSLDALCKRYGVSNSHRKLHGALVDAELLALVYLAMTGGQTSLFGEESISEHVTETRTPLAATENLAVIFASPEEIQAHEQILKEMQNKNGKCLWLEEN